MLGTSGAWSRPVDHRSDLIKRLFAVVVSVGFAGALASSSWVKGQRLPAPGDIVHLLVLVSGLMLIVGSWEGFHKHADKTNRSVLLFATDIGLVFTYLVVLLLAAEPRVFLWMVAVVFGLYALWNALVVAIFKEPAAQHGFAVASLWCIGFLYLSFVWGRVPGQPLAAAFSVAVAAIVFRLPRFRTVRWTLAAIGLACLPHILPLYLP